ncbi:MAG: hypothetical protein HKN47_17595 [Pirellulaceae bacterium]|nr:hypothetical protein [Pirellulaceae bacterium]
MTRDPWTIGTVVCGASDVRRNWLRMMGLSDEEIEKHCSLVPPTDIDEEVAEYNAMCDIQQLNAKYHCDA